MRVTVFTRNQPRHLALIEALNDAADELFVVQECNTVFPGRVEDHFRRSPIMQRYFAHVIAAEAEVFGRPRFSPPDVRQLVLKGGDLNLVDLDVLRPALNADVYVVFGASYIRGALIDFLAQRPAFNLHMGVSPYYRGNSCNFWALYDGRPELVGATIHRLTRGLDSGPILFHALPAPQRVSPFVFGMLAVRAAHRGFVRHLQSGRLFTLEPQVQDRAREMRYTRNVDFTDAIAEEYLARQAQDGGQVAASEVSGEPYHNPFRGEPWAGGPAAGGC